MYSDFEFRAHFRMSRATVEILCSELVLTGILPV